MSRVNVMTWETVRWCLANGVLTKSGFRWLRMRITSSLVSSWSVLVQSGLTKSRWNSDLHSETDSHISQRVLIATRIVKSTLAKT
jgi:hypothetical protein